MSEIKLNIGNIWERRFLNDVIALNKQYEGRIRVASMFGSVRELTPTARSMDRLPIIGWDQVKDIVSTARENNINIRYTLNQACLGSMQDFKLLWDNNLKEAIEKLHNIGVNEWTVTSPLLMKELRTMFPSDMIEVSTIAEIVSPQDIVRFMQFGANAIDLSTSINRDFVLLNYINQEAGLHDVTVELLANEACLFRCPLRRDCYNFSSHNSIRGADYFNSYPFGWCSEIRNASPVEWLKARMILPQWMRIYQNRLGIDFFKLAFRTHPYEVAIKSLKIYMSEQFDGNYTDLWPTISKLASSPDNKELFISCKKLDEVHFLDYFLENGHECGLQSCFSDCRYCDSVLEKVI